MTKSYLSLLDDVLGFTGVLLVLVAVSEAGSGHGRIPEPCPYLLIDVEVLAEGDTRVAIDPPAPLFGESALGLSAVVAPVIRRGPRRFSLVLYASARQSRTSAQAGARGRSLGGPRSTSRSARRPSREPGESSASLSPARPHPLVYPSSPILIGSIGSRPRRGKRAKASR